MSTLAAQTDAALKGLAWIGSDPAVQLARTQVWEAAPTDLPVLLLGEPGTGRQLAAHLLHALSPRQQQPFIRVDCAALHPSEVATVLFEGTPASSPRESRSRAPRQAQPSVLAQADGGTLYLDGLEALPVEVQQQFLFHLPRPSRAHTSSPPGIRVVATTRADLQREARTGAFCPPLFYRLAILPVHLPPLRQRGRDLDLLATHFMRQTRVRAGRITGALPRAGLEALHKHDWPGNVWELKRFCERAALLPGNQPLTPERIARLLEVAPWNREYQTKPVSKWTSPWHRSPSRN